MENFLRDSMSVDLKEADKKRTWKLHAYENKKQSLYS